jgi:hypothetical protein
VVATIKTLDELISGHDVVFLLTDTRERFVSCRCRWLRHFFKIACAAACVQSMASLGHCTGAPQTTVQHRPWL